MKKLLLLLAMAIMVIGLVAGCGKSADNGGDKKSAHILHFLHLKLSFLFLKRRKHAVGDDVSFLRGGEQRAVRLRVVGIHGADFKRADILLDAAQFFLALAVFADELSGLCVAPRADKRLNA